jgi:prepilin-type N-terminal cleavage/methylation domain-containing protein
MSNRGYSLLELLITLGIIGVVSAAAIPTVDTVLRRNRLYAASQLVASQLRTARLSAITRNTPVRVAFNCPGAGSIQILEVTGVKAIDDAADRCRMNRAGDGPVIWLPANVTFTAGPVIEFSGRGIVSAESQSMPVSIKVNHGMDTRTVVVTGIGKISMAPDA